jgi:hypothetical protein
MNGQYNALQQSLRLLASSPDVQIDVLPDNVHKPDELALIFSDAFVYAPQLVATNTISQQVFAALEEIGQLLDKMSNVKNLWSIDAISTDNNWAVLRAKSMHVLELIGEEYTHPDLSHIKHIQG